jgi:hypothetical protein
MATTIEMETELALRKNLLKMQILNQFANSVDQKFKNGDASIKFLPSLVIRNSRGKIILLEYDSLMGLYREKKLSISCSTSKLLFPLSETKFAFEDDKKLNHSYDIKSNTSSPLEVDNFLQVGEDIQYQVIGPYPYSYSPGVILLTGKNLKYYAVGSSSSYFRNIKIGSISQSKTKIITKNVNKLLYNFTTIKKISPNWSIVNFSSSNAQLMYRSTTKEAYEFKREINSNGDYCNLSPSSFSSIIIMIVSIDALELRILTPKGSIANKYIEQLEFESIYQSVALETNVMLILGKMEGAYKNLTIAIKTFSCGIGLDVTIHTQYLRLEINLNIPPSEILFIPLAKNNFALINGNVQIWTRSSTVPNSDYQFQWLTSLELSSEKPEVLLFPVPLEAKKSVITFLQFLTDIPNDLLMSTIDFL